MKKVSVIIPIYNVEQYLAKSLDSVINQTYKDLEIICVNDCSPDNSAKILQEYALKDNRIKIVNRENNGGLSAARNSGLEVATGEYVYFIDSDDWIDLDYLEKMVEKIEDNDVDIVVNTNIIKESEDKSEHFVWQRYAKTDKNGEFLDKVTAINNSQCMIWCHLYKREFLIKNKLRFPEGYIHEDEYFQHITKNLLDNLFAFYGASYHYRQRQDSIMSAKKSKVESYIKIFNLIYDFYISHNLLSKENRIKIFRIECIDKIESEQDFFCVKQYLDKIGKDFEEERMASSDYEKYIYNKIKHLISFKEYNKKVGKYPLQLYLSKGKILRNNNIKVSVIIPVYNVEKYLRKCLDSVCAQTLEDIEIICVNDCSPDDSIEILKEYASKDNRIKIIDFKENRGVAVARNEAIKIATGEYIGFVDSDDWIDLDFYEKLYKKAKEDNVDLVIGNLLKNNQGKNSFLHNMANRVKQNKIYFSGLFWLGIYSTKLIRENNLSFTEGLKYGEDRLFPILAAYYANKISVVDNAYYYYFTRDDSATVEFYENEDKVNDFIESSKLILKYFNQLNYNEDDYNIFIKEYLFSIIIIFLKAPKSNQVKLKELYFFYITNLKYQDLINTGFEKNVLEAMTNNDMVTLSKLVQMEQKCQIMIDLKQYLKFKNRGVNV